MATFGDLYGTLLDRELGSADRTDLFTTARRKAAVNEAQKEFVRLTECLTSQGTISIVDGTAEYDIEATLTSFLWIAKDGVEIKNVGTSRTVWYAGDDLVRCDIPQLNREEPGWRSASAGTPTKYYIRDDGGKTYLGFYPAPDVGAGETWTAYVTYVVNPTDMSLDADEPFTVSSDVKITLRPWHQALVHFAASKMEALRRHFTLEDRQRQLFAAYVADYFQHQRRKGPQRVQYLRNYRGELRSSRPPDPWRWP